MENIAMIVSLGGLEFMLWFLDRRAAKRDHEMQNQQLEILDEILTDREYSRITIHRGSRKKTIKP